MTLLEQRSVVPGFRLTLGFTLAYLSLIVLVPLATVFAKAAGAGWTEFWLAATSPRVLASYRLTFIASACAAFINALFGLLIAWVLVRYRFPGKGIVSALVDLPFALPTAVAGIAFTALYAETGWIGALVAPAGIRIAYTQLGIILVLTFIGLPFVVRTVQPVLETLDQDIEEAAAILGATRFTTFRRVLLPAILPALLTGFALAFARAIGEYGSVIFIAGNMPMKTEIAPLLIMTELDQFDYHGAAAIAVVLLITSFSMLLLINLLQAYNRRRTA